MRHTTALILFSLSATAYAANTAEPPTLDDLLGPAEPRPVPTMPTTPEGIEDAISDETPADLLNAALDNMQMAARRLGRQFDVGEKTQSVQEEAIRKLDELIRQASQSSSSSSAQQQQASQPRQNEEGQSAQPQPGQQQPGQPQPTATMNPQDPGTTSGSVQGVLEISKPIEELRREWGSLPPRIRQELSESLSEPLSPSHRSQTEAYFKTLAELENETTP